MVLLILFNIIEPLDNATTFLNIIDEFQTFVNRSKYLKHKIKCNVLTIGYTVNISKLFDGAANIIKLE